MPAAGREGANTARPMVAGRKKGSLVCCKGCRQVSGSEATDAAGIGVGTGQTQTIDDMSMAIKCSQMHRRVAGVVLNIRIGTPGQKASNKPSQPQRSSEVEETLSCCTASVVPRGTWAVVQIDEF